MVATASGAAERAVPSACIARARALRAAAAGTRNALPPSARFALRTTRGALPHCGVRAGRGSVAARAAEVSDPEAANSESSRGDDGGSTPHPHATQGSSSARPITPSEGAEGQKGRRDDPGTASVLATFRWPAALGGEEVAVVGDFNGWSEPAPMRRSPETDDFVRSLALRPGTYQYKFLVDGVWCTNPCDPVAADSGGRYNNQRLVVPTSTFTWKKEWGGEAVYLAGDFTGWVELLPLKVDPKTGDFKIKCALKPGTYSYQFLVDGDWLTSPAEPITPNEQGWMCNQRKLDSVPAFHIYYATGWEQPVLRVRSYVPELEGSKTKNWKSVPMFRAPSRSHPSGGVWWKAVIPTPARASSKTEMGGPSARPALDFYIEEGKSKAPKDAEGDENGSAPEQDAPGTDKPRGKEFYKCPTPGGYKLQAGVLKPFPASLSPSVMVVSDLDGTMVGDGLEADAATRAFADYWEDNGAAAGSVLVYNTGRSLGQFKSLLEEKEDALALPDVLITAVGTKIFMLDEANCDRSLSTGELWREDMAWSKRLDKGWDLGKVQAIGEKMVEQFEDCHWLDKGTEHPHRIALSVNVEVLDGVIGTLKNEFKNADVQVRIIQSGLGDWRYVDCVSIGGGKLEALEYVRTLYGVSADRCVACGDSCNDILMLEGKNKGIVVGNAQPELMDWVLEQSQEQPRVVYTDAEMARGILEGLASCRQMFKPQSLIAEGETRSKCLLKLLN